VLAAHGIEVHVLPAEYTAEAVAAALAAAADLNGARVLWPCGASARTELADELTRRGARIDPVVTYRTVIDHAAGAALRGEVAAGAFDVVTFTSPSTVRAFAECGEVVLGGTRIATIGPVTATEAGRWGLPVHIEPRDHTTAALARAIDRYYGAAPRQAADREDEP
jgi:uroporphyrinogen-III synthase